MRANLAWLLALVCLVGLAAGWLSRGERILCLSLLLSNRPIVLAQGQPLLVEGDCFRLELRAAGEGSVRMITSARYRGVVSEGLSQTIPASQWATLEGQLLALPGWREPKCDGQEPEGQVLYTLLETSTTRGQYRSCWRGLPAAQARVATTLLASPAGGSLARALAQLQGVRKIK